MGLYGIVLIFVAETPLRKVTATTVGRGCHFFQAINWLILETFPRMNQYIAKLLAQPLLNF